MSFRVEEKLNIDKKNIDSFKAWIIENHGIKIFPDRKIVSEYFDNEQLDMHYEGEEGIVPRKKIRIRHYLSKDNKIKDYFLEKKINSIEGRFKISKKIHNYKNILKKGFIEPSYGVCKAKVRVEYMRSYFKIFDVRLTFDRDIAYSKFNSKLKKKDDSIIVEIKSQNLNFINHIQQRFPFNRIRFSKYSRAILHTQST
jgi:hypothetical protein